MKLDYPRRCTQARPGCTALSISRRGRSRECGVPCTDEDPRCRDGSDRCRDICSGLIRRCQLRLHTGGACLHYRSGVEAQWQFEDCRLEDALWVNQGDALAFEFETLQEDDVRNAILIQGSLLV